MPRTRTISKEGKSKLDGFPVLNGHGSKVVKVKADETGYEYVAGGAGGVDLGETDSTAYRGDRGKTAYDHSQAAHAPANAVTQAAAYTDQEVTSLADATATALLGKSDTNHSHDYAASDHTHNEYALANHTHNDLDPFVAKLILSADVPTGANTTLVTLTGMTFDYEANSTYVIEFYMIVTAAAATTGHGFGVNCSTAITNCCGAGNTQLANTGTTTSWQFITNNAIVGVTSGVPTANALTPSFGQGVLITGANAGTCQFRFRSETTAVTICKAGSCITVKKMN